MMILKTADPGTGFAVFFCLKIFDRESGEIYNTY